jgi:hypothetical protein
MRSERLAAFIFRLGRDNLPTGIIEEQVTVVERAHGHDDDVEYVPSAEHLGDWARSMADRLLAGLNEEQAPNSLLASMREVIEMPYVGVPESEDAEETRQRQADADRRDQAHRYRQLADLVREASVP